MKKASLQFGTYVWLFIILLVLFLFYFQRMVTESTQKLKAEEILKTEQYAQHISEWILKETDGNLSTALGDPVLREHMNKLLETFIIPKYRYIFVLKKDEKGRYRFLLDGSKEEKEEYMAHFFPKSKLFDEVYRTQKIAIVRQKDNVEELWLSLLYPIVIDGKTEALLVLDLSKWYGEYIENFNSPLSHVIRLMQIFLFLSFAFMLVVFFRYRYIQKKILLDPLTRAYSKLYLEDYFNRHKVDDHNALLIDIDEFNEVNRIYGYEKGDYLLQEFVKTLKELLPGSASVVRIGGAEFFVFFDKHADLEKVANDLFHGSKKKRYTVGNETVTLNISMSALNIPEDTRDILHVLRLLDEELLKIKSRGKNQFSILDPQSYKDLQYRQVDYIKQALEDERLVCLYQPIYRTDTKEIYKYEALVRLVDAENPETLIGPADFIDKIRGTSQYIKMSKLVLKTVFDVLEKYDDIEVSVNIDLDDLFNADMMEMIMHHLRQHEKAAKRLTFEILEQNEIRDYDKVNVIFTQLREYGSKIAIDDFGSGYSNYSYLIRMNIDILKIDGSLVCELANNGTRAKEVLASIKTLSDRFGYELVAEFVSSAEVFEEIRKLGIPYAQGFYLGKPAPIETFIKPI